MGKSQQKTPAPIGGVVAHHVAHERDVVVLDHRIWP
jgi:hypothetical protein